MTAGASTAMGDPDSNRSVAVILHTGVIYLWVILVTIIFGLLTTLTSFFSKTGNLPHLVARVWGGAILLVSGIRVRISGMERLDRSRSYIFMSNHQSNFDIPVLLSRLKVQFRWLAKAELFKIPIFGRGMHGAGYIPIDRSNRKAAFQSLAHAAESIRRGSSVMVFPEGTRTRDGNLQPFKKGGFVLAVDAGAPIVPLVIRGTFDIMPKNGLLIRRRAVQVQIFDPIESSEYTRKTKDDLMARVHAVMSEALQPEALPAGGRNA